MHISKKERKQLFKKEKQHIQEQIRKLVFNFRDFSFHPTKDKSFLKNKEKPEDISDLETEEFMMRFFGLYVQKSKIKKWIKIILFFSVIFFAYFNWDKVQIYLQSIVNKVPFVSNTLSFLLVELNARSLLGIFLLSFFVNLFFISFPDEIYFITYLLAGHNPIILIPVIAIGGLMGLTVDYIIGKIIGVAVLRGILKEKYYKFKFTSDKWGGLFLVFGNLVPSPVQWFSVALGAFNYGYKRFIFWSAIGKFSKYIALFFGFNYFTNTVNPFIDESLKPALENVKYCLNQTNTTVPFLT